MLANYPKEDERILMEIPGGIHVKDRKREWTKEREREREREREKERGGIGGGESSFISLNDSLFLGAGPLHPSVG